MRRAFAWVMLVISIGMLFLGLGVAERIKIPVVAFWALILVLCLRSLFFKKR